MQSFIVCNNSGVGKDEGLRARKQRQTRDAIHRAAVGLALEVGIDAATVADISARADVSPRTFFNYYPTKEDAIVGLHEGLPSDEELDELRHGSSGDLIGDILALLQGIFTPPDESLFEQRKALVTEHPGLIQRQWSRLIGVEQRIARAVADRMRASAALSELDDIDQAALTLVVTCNAVMRLSIRKVIDHDIPVDEIGSHVSETLHTLREVLRILP